MRRWRPHLVIGAGGYVMAPAILAATILRLPRVVMEQNVIPGMTVRTMARYAHRVFTAFAESARYLPGRRVQCTGTPIRQDIGTVVRMPQEPDDARLHLFIFGGSQGAHRLNQAAIDMLPHLHKYRHRLALVHQTGEADCSAVTQAYAQHGVDAKVAPFLYDMAYHYHWAHLIICRAGASTLAELTACGKPAILVPYPYAADNHQWHNAMALQQQGAAQVIPDAEFTGARLYAELKTLLLHPERLQQQAAQSRQLARPQAAEAIVTACLQLLHILTPQQEAL
jgi:UDP-N-acetylglucosamine--N-acetylmuramyl-(pentapeptide) pyrophosphoryl-undecaprenol N-acetylglucosamine transferase